MESPEIALLSLSRLLSRLEHNLLSPSADLSTLRKDEFQRMRVGANVEYARSMLSSLEKTLPQIKPAERRHGIQNEVSRLKAGLKGVRGVLVDAASYLSRYGDADGSDDDEEEEEEGKEKEAEWDDEDFGPLEDEDCPIEEKDWEQDQSGQELMKRKEPTISTPVSTAAAIHTTHMRPSSTTAIAEPISGSTLRNRQQKSGQYKQPAQSAPSVEHTLSAHRHEQEDLTASLLTLAAQLKTSSQSFQSQLESEKSILARAIEGIDRTASNMEAAEKRMGLLRRMTEGRGWWGRVILYVWILAGWILAILIVFVGPKLRF